MIITRPKRVLGPQYDMAALLEKQLMQRNHVKRPLERIKKMRVYLRARLSGAPIKEANRMAGYPASTPAACVMAAPLVPVILNEMCKEPEFQDAGIVKRLKEMWNHTRTRFQKVGDDVEKIEEDDPDMWKYSMDKVLHLRGYLKNGKEPDTGTTIEASGGITFNVLQIPNE